jgi:ectoine hydroxylase-related dioxygenase (phytanoyl-CoA dioxygenase family)
MKSISQSLDNQGFAIIENIYTQEEIAKIIAVINQNQTESANYRLNQDLFAIRNLLAEIPDLKNYLFTKNFNLLKQSVMSENYFLIKAIYFDKPPLSNWSVYWHQDVTISVKQKVETAGFGHWTRKNDIISVIPPLNYLENTITIRIHLDDCDLSNGGLKVIPNSHKQGLLDTQAIQNWRETQPAQVCEIKQGGILLMKPLLLHASTKSVSQQHRRVIHLEFCNQLLPENLEWREN